MSPNAPPTIGSAIAEIDARVEHLEKARLGNWVTIDGVPVQTFPSGITIGPSGDFVLDSVPVPVNVTVTTQAFFDSVDLLVDWDAPTDLNANQVREYEVDVAEVGFGVSRQIRTGGTNARVAGVKPQKNYEVRVRSINKLNATSAFVNADPFPILSGRDTTIPSAPTGVTASSDTTARAVQVRWNENPEEDVKGGAGIYEWEVSTSNTVDPETGDFLISPRRDRTSATIIATLDLATGTQYYAHVRAIDSSDNFSVWSDIVAATPGLLVDADIANLSAAKVTFGQMSGDRIAANTADIGILKTSELDAAIITITSGGMIRIGRTVPPYHYIIYDENGKRMYKNGTAPFTGGDLVTDENVATGSAFFGGSLVAGVSITSPIVNGGQLNAVTLSTSNAVFGGTTPAVWTNIGYGIIDNEAYVPSPGNFLYLAHVDTGQADGFWGLKVRTSPTGNRAWVGILFRYQDTNNYWLAEIRNTATGSGAYLWKLIGGVYTQVGYWAFNLSANTIYNLRLFTEGNEIYFYVNNILYIRHIDSALASRTRGGMFLAGGPSNDDGGSRFLEFTTRNISDNFNRPNHTSSLGATTTSAKVGVDGTGLVALGPEGQDAFRLYAASGEMKASGFFRTDIVQASKGVFGDVSLTQLSALTGNKIVVAGQLEMNNNTIWFNTSFAPDNRMEYNNAQNGVDIFGAARFRLAGIAADAGLRSDAGELHVMGSAFSTYRGIRASAFPVSSDEKFKTNIVELSPEECANKLVETKPKKYKMNGKDAIGFVAQDVSDVARSDTKESAGYDLVAQAAINWGATLWLKQEIEKLKKR